MSSHGVARVVECGVERYAPRKRCNSTSHGVCDTFDLRMIAPKLRMKRSQVAFALGHSGVMRWWRKPSESANWRNCALSNRGPLSDLTRAGTPRRAKTSSMAGITACAAVVETFLTTGYLECSSTSTRRCCLAPNGPYRSMLTSVQSSSGIVVIRRGVILVVSVLAAHDVHVRMCCATSYSMSGNHTCLLLQRWSGAVAVDAVAAGAVAAGAVADGPS